MIDLDLWLQTAESNQSGNFIQKIQSTNFPQIQCQQDVYLMEVFENEGFIPKELQKINRCRIYLNVLTLSDIMTCSGNRFTCTHKVEKDNTRVSKFQWPITVHPGSSCTKLWRKALHTMFGLAAGITIYMLGIWLHNDFSKWKCLFDPNTNLVFQVFGRIWKVWARSGSGALGRASTFCYSNNALSLPQTAVRATVKLNPYRSITLTGWSSHLAAQDTLHNSNINNNMIHNPIITIGFIQEIIHDIINVQAIAVSDGSFNPEHKDGSVAWVIELYSRTACQAWSNISPGTKDIQNP